MSRSIAGLFRNQEITDLTLVCKDGHLVETHVSLLAILSKELGEVFSSLPTLPNQVIVPDVEKEAVEEVLMLYSKEWREKRLNLEQMKVADLLGFPLLSKSDRNSQVPRSRNEQNMVKHENNRKKTMPSMLVQLKQEAKETLENTPNSETDFSEAETELNFEMNTCNPHPRVDVTVTSEEQAVQDLNDQIDLGLVDPQSCVMEKTTDDGSTFNCAGCGTYFEERSSLRVHIGEVHMGEEELEVQLSEAFPGGTFTCALCQEMCGSDYQMKEHVMLNHPWTALEELVEKSEKEGNNQIEFENNIEDAAEYESRPEKYKETVAAEKTSEKEESKERKRKSCNDLQWASGTTYSCNYCENIYYRIPLARSHILKIHRTKIERGEYPNHMSFESKKYSCKICHQQIEHNPDNIRAHTLNRHRMKIHKYGASYETNTKRTRVDPGVKIPKNPVIPKNSPGTETFPEEMQSFLDKIRAKTANAVIAGRSALVPPYDYPIEFSDSSDDED